MATERQVEMTHPTGDGTQQPKSLRLLHLGAFALFQLLFPGLTSHVRPGASIHVGTVLVMELQNGARGDVIGVVSFTRALMASL